jgi:hypothetical protein
MQLYFLFWVVQYFDYLHLLFKGFNFYSAAMANLQSALGQRNTPASPACTSTSRTKVSAQPGYSSVIEGQRDTHASHKLGPCALRQGSSSQEHKHYKLNFSRLCHMLRMLSVVPYMYIPSASVKCLHSCNEVLCGKETTFGYFPSFYMKGPRLTNLSNHECRNSKRKGSPLIENCHSRKFISLAE